MAKKYNSLDEVPDFIREKLKKYFTNVGGRTFAIHGLPAELTGGLLARYSRTQTGIQLTLVNEFLDENGEPSQIKGSEIMDRVLNAFGDDSVGELEGCAVGIEEISQVGTKFIEDRRIGGSPIEQSTRYVKYDVKDTQGRWRYLRPKEIVESGLLEKFERVNDRAFEVYSEGVKRLIEYFKGQLPRDKFQIEVKKGDNRVKLFEKELDSDDERRNFNNAYSFTVRCAALDVGRCVLPSATLTQLGLGNASNARFYTTVLNHMKSHELAESRERAFELEAELNKVIPTYIKRNAADPKVAERNKKMRGIAGNLFSGMKPEADKVTLLPREDYLDEVVASALYPYTNVSLKQIAERVLMFPQEFKLNLFDNYIGERESRRNRSGRGLEAGYPLTFDLVGGFAEYRDLERHRMLTQQRQNLTTDLGFIMPPELGIVGLEKEVLEVADMMSDLNGDIKHSGQNEAAQYATLFNNRMRFMLGMNLREFQHLSELRTQPAGHFSYRQMVMEMANQVGEMYPWTKKAFGFVDYSDPGNKIARAKEQSRIAGKNIAKGIDGGIDY